MNLGLKYREWLPPMVAEELDNIIATINAWSDQQHDGEGAHTDVTATATSTTGDLSIGGNLSVGGAADIASSLTVGGATDLQALTAHGLTTTEGLTVNGVLTPNSGIGNHLIPTLTDTYDLGSSTKLWSQAYISQINAVLFAKETVSLYGGWLMVGHNAGTLAASITSGATTADFGQAMTVGDFILIRAADAGGTIKAEYLQIGALVSGTIYNVTRDLASAHSTDPAWAAGTPYLVLGTTGDGRIELNAYDTPRLSIIKQGATYNAQTEYVRLGYLDSFLGIAAGKIGLGIGDATQYLTYYDGVLSVKGNITATAGTIGGWTLGATSLTSGSGGTTVGLDSGGTNPALYAGSATPGSAPFRVTAAGALTATNATLTGSLTAGYVTIDSTSARATPTTDWAVGRGWQFAMANDPLSGMFGSQNAYIGVANVVQSVMVQAEVRNDNNTHRGAIATLRATRADANGSIDDIAQIQVISADYLYASTREPGFYFGSTAGGLPAFFEGAINERDRTTPMGEFVAGSSTYSATGSGGTWTVEAGDVQTMRYAIVGKAYTLIFSLVNTVTNASATFLQMTIPGGYTAAATTANQITYYESTTPQWGGGHIMAQAGSNTLTLYGSSGSSAGWGAKTIGIIRGQITFEIQ